MCWSFSFFVIGLVLSTTIQALLTWCAKLQEYPFSTPSLWELILGIGVYLAMGFVFSAMCILMLTVKKLNYTEDPHVDAPLVFSTDPRPPAFLAFSVSFFPLSYAAWWCIKMLTQGNVDSGYRCPDGSCRLRAVLGCKWDKSFIVEEKLRPSECGEKNSRRLSAARYGVVKRDLTPDGAMHFCFRFHFSLNDCSMIVCVHAYWWLCHPCCFSALYTATSYALTLHIYHCYTIVITCTHAHS